MTPTADGHDSERRQHWGSVYAEKDTDEVSWFEASPTFSLAMLDVVGADSSMAVIDVGAGASRLAGALLERGFTDITALDVADEGLAAARNELGSDADKITWLVENLLTWSPRRRYDVWHDRAFFHFLNTPAQQRRYLTTAQAALVAGAKVIIATFAEDGPEQCSGLPVARYSPARLVDTLNAHGGATFELLEHRREEHCTPWGSIQPFTWCALAYSGQHATLPGQGCGHRPHRDRLNRALLTAPRLDVREDDRGDAAGSPTAVAPAVATGTSISGDYLLAEGDCARWPSSAPGDSCLTSTRTAKRPVPPRTLGEPSF